MHISLSFCTRNQCNFLVLLWSGPVWDSLFFLLLGKWMVMGTWSGHVAGRSLMLTWGIHFDNPSSSMKRTQRNTGPAQHSQVIPNSVHFSGPEDKLFSFVLYFDIILSFVPILGQCEGNCALAFVGFNEAGFDSISYQVSSFVCMGRRAEKCSFNWYQQRRQKKTRKNW